MSLGVKTAIQQSMKEETAEKKISTPLPSSGLCELMNAVLMSYSFAADEED